MIICFNPLNQVYVFNKEAGYGKKKIFNGTGFNPLNQVYVFNTVTCCKRLKMYAIRF